jgi:hypothetical protein
LIGGSRYKMRERLSVGEVKALAPGMCECKE